MTDHARQLIRALPKRFLSLIAVPLLIGGIDLKHGSLKAWYER